MPVSKKAIELFEKTSGITIEEANKRFDDCCDCKGEEMKPVIVTNTFRISMDNLIKAARERIADGGSIDRETSRYLNLLDKYDLDCVIGQNMSLTELCDFVEAEFGDSNVT